VHPPPFVRLGVVRRLARVATSANKTQPTSSFIHHFPPFRSSSEHSSRCLASTINRCSPSSRSQRRRHSASDHCCLLFRPHTFRPCTRRHYRRPLHDNRRCILSFHHRHHSSPSCRSRCRRRSPSDYRSHLVYRHATLFPFERQQRHQPQLQHLPLLPSHSLTSQWPQEQQQQQLVPRRRHRQP
jgi:hypothetical protein